VQHFTLIPLDNYNNNENPRAARLAGFRRVQGHEINSYSLKVPDFYQASGQRAVFDIYIIDNRLKI